MKKTAPSKEIIIVRGGGIAGRSLALLLAHDGFQVALVEQALAADEHKDPRAYALNASSVQLLQDLHVWPAEKACPVHDMQIQGDHGNLLLFSAWEQEVGALTHIVPAVVLEQALGQAVQYHPRIERLIDSENLHLPQASLVVICEGRDSPTRASFGFEMQAHAYHHRALAARLQTEKKHGNIARQWFDGQGVLALLPLNSDEHSPYGEVSLIWSLPQSVAHELQVLPEDAFLARLEEASNGALGALTLQTPVVGWDLRFAHAKRWIARTNGQTAVLVADAAHTMHPLAGQGLNVGLGDVMALARTLRETPEWRDISSLRALRPYERSRQAAFMKVGGLCDTLFHLYTNPSRLAHVLRNNGMGLVNRCNPVKKWLVKQASSN